MNALLGRRAFGSSPRMEAELTAWLRLLEPSGTPTALRIRTFADLQAEAERPRRRLAWLAPALSAAASLGATLLLVALAAFLAVAQAHQSAAGAQPSTPETPTDTAAAAWNMGVLAMALTSSVLAGAVVYLAWPRRLISGLAYGARGVMPADPLPLRRPWRTVSPWVWVLALLTVVAVWLFVRHFVRMGLPLPAEASVTYLAYMLALAPLALIVAWRYPVRDRSGAFLLGGALCCLAWLLLLGARDELGLLNWLDSNLWFDLELCLVAILATAGTVGLAAGLAVRAGVTRRPPLRLAALAVGVAFLLGNSLISVATPADTASTGSVAPSFAQQVYVWLNGLSQWATILAWLAILWVGIAAAQRVRSKAWVLVVAAALSALIAHVAIHGLVLCLGLGLLADPLPVAPMVDAALRLNNAAAALAQVALLAGLVAGLRPAVQSVNPAPPDRPPLEA